MKIVYLMTQDLVSPAGVGRIFPLARELAARGHHPTILALHSDFGGQDERQFTRQGVAVEYVGQMHVRKHDDQKTYFSAPELAVVVTNATYQLTRAALRTPADILHIVKPHPMNSIAALTARIGRDTPLVVDCDDLEVANNRFASGWQKNVLGYFERQVPRLADAVTTHSNYLREHLHESGIADAKIHDLPNGVDTQRFAQIDPQQVQAIRRQYGLVDRPVVGYIGSLSTTSHPIEILLQAFVSVQSDCPDSRLLIVGGGEDFHRLQEITRRIDLAACVTFTGRVAPDQVPAYYAACDVIVDPVEDNLVGKTRLPIKLFESWAAGTAFITADVGDRARVLGDPPAGLLVPPGDPAALAAAIRKLISNPELKQSILQSASQRSRAYTWHKIAADIENLYLGLLNAR